MRKEAIGACVLFIFVWGISCNHDIATEWSLGERSMESCVEYNGYTNGNALIVYISNHCGPACFYLFSEVQKQNVIKEIYCIYIDGSNYQNRFYDQRVDPRVTKVPSVQLVNHTHGCSSVHIFYNKIDWNYMLDNCQGTPPWITLQYETIQQKVQAEKAKRSPIMANINFCVSLFANPINSNGFVILFLTDQLVNTEKVYSNVFSLFQEEAKDTEVSEIQFIVANSEMMTYCGEVLGVAGALFIRNRNFGQVNMGWEVELVHRLKASELTSEHFIRGLKYMRKSLPWGNASDKNLLDYTNKKMALLLFQQKDKPLYHIVSSISDEISDIKYLFLDLNKYAPFVRSLGGCNESEVESAAVLINFDNRSFYRVREPISPEGIARFFQMYKEHKIAPSMKCTDSEKNAHNNAPHSQHMQGRWEYIPDIAVQDLRSIQRRDEASLVLFYRKNCAFSIPAVTSMKEFKWSANFDRKSAGLTEKQLREISNFNLYMYDLQKNPIYYTNLLQIPSIIAYSPITLRRDPVSVQNFLQTSLGLVVASKKWVETWAS